MIVLDIGHTYIKAFNKESNKIYSFALNEEEKFFQWLLQFNKKSIFIGSVNLNFNLKFKSFLKQYKINYYFLKKEDFLKFLKLKSKVKKSEIGLDILSMIYLIKDQNYILINNGTAMTITLYTKKIDGVIIGTNIFDSLANLLEKTKLPFRYTKNSNTFSNNTSDSFSSYINLFFIDPLLRLAKINKINKIYIHQIDKKYIKQIRDINFFHLNQPTLKGYIELASNMKLK